MDEGGQYLYKSNMAEATQPTQIQNFNLFGEHADLPDVVHCETIEYRSSLHNWELTAHRHPRLHQILVIETGGGSIEVEGERTGFGAATAINIPAGVVHGFEFLPDTQGWVVTLATETLDETLVDAEGLRAYLARVQILADCIHLKPPVEQLFDEYAAGAFGRAQILRSLCGVVTGLLAREAAKAALPVSQAPEANLYRRFQELVEQRYAGHWPVARYADELAVTPGHLSRVCRQAVGVSASGVIRERGMREARRLLTYTNLSIAQIAYELGFIDPAYFTRVFGREYGKSPREFRSGLSG